MIIRNIIVIKFFILQNNSVQSPASMPSGGFNAGTAPVAHMPSESTPGFQPEAPFMPAAANTPGMPAGAPLAGGPPTMPQQMTSQGPPMAPSAAAPVMGVPCDPSSDQGGSGKILMLPDWLSDKSTLPAVYVQARSLVEGTEGWVDTSRAYMLLMKTGLPPPFLGVLWEMVNKTKPGHLRDQEFMALLALVALVQVRQWADFEINEREKALVRFSLKRCCIFSLFGIDCKAFLHIY